jgi:diguanylate cyclase (GGDEF)-like protein
MQAAAQVAAKGTAENFALQTSAVQKIQERPCTNASRAALVFVFVFVFFALMISPSASVAMQVSAQIATQFPSAIQSSNQTAQSAVLNATRDPALAQAVDAPKSEAAVQPKPEAAPTAQSPATKRHTAPPRQAAPVVEQTAEPTAPREISYVDASSGRYTDQLVTISGDLVSELNDADSYSVIISTDGHLVTGFLPQTSNLRLIQPGSRVRITGICRFVTTDPALPAHFIHVEMRNGADFQLISEASWFTLPHYLFLLGAGLTVALGIFAFFYARHAVIRWRDRSQAAWIDRSMVIARERSRILEMISSNHKLEELLSEICKSTMQLLPGSHCGFSLQIQDDRGTTIQADQVDAYEHKLFEVSLHDDSNRVNGKIVVSAQSIQNMPVDREEIFKVLSELAPLAMRQSLLYRGLVYHSTHDPLTELPNRRLCESRLAATIEEAELNGGQMAVIYIDINRFKFVNDKYGHKVGDLYLKAIAQRLRSQLRPIDTLARIGGDEFVVIAPFPEAYDRAFALTIRLESCFEEPFDLEGVMIEGSASFGFARYPEHGKTAEELTRHADHAMYISKHEARISEEAHGIAIITPDELKLALLTGRFRLAYQPQFSSAGRITGLEALIRLEDPVLGLLTPEAFISVAEQHPVIIDIGAWALRTALQDANRWKLNTGDQISIAVNASVRQLEEPGYATSVLECLREFDFPPERLEIELVERSLMFSGDKVTLQLERLRNAGVRISLDDFGTEQSCLSLLHKLPIDTIKLDRSFIRAMDGEPGVLPIIQAIVSMAQSLGKRVVAEAIEHAGPVPKLMRMGEMDFQGYLLSRPVAADEVHLHMNKWRSGIRMPEAFEVATTGLRRVS